VTNDGVWLRWVVGCGTSRRWLPGSPRSEVLASVAVSVSVDDKWPRISFPVDYLGWWDNPVDNWFGCRWCLIR
jgi:hypothetical protein